MIKFSTTELLLPEHMVHYKNANVHHIVFYMSKNCYNTKVQLHAAKAVYNAGD